MKPLTYPEPFMLQSDLRGQSHRRKLEEQLERDRREKENKTKFKAQPFREVEPFIPSKSSKPITEPEHVMLHSELRAEERRAFEEELKEKEKLAEEMRQRQLRDQEVSWWSSSKEYVSFGAKRAQLTGKGEARSCQAPQKRCPQGRTYPCLCAYCDQAFQQAAYGRREPDDWRQAEANGWVAIAAPERVDFV